MRHSLILTRSLSLTFEVNSSCKDEQLCTRSCGLHVHVSELDAVKILWSAALPWVSLSLGWFLGCWGLGLVVWRVFLVRVTQTQ